MVRFMAAVDLPEREPPMFTHIFEARSLFSRGKYMFCFLLFWVAVPRRIPWGLVKGSGMMDSVMRVISEFGRRDWRV